MTGGDIGMLNLLVNTDKKIDATGRLAGGIGKMQIYLSHQSSCPISAIPCRFRWLSDLNADRLEKWLLILAETPKDEDTPPALVSASVYNGYVEAWTALGN